MNTSNHTEKYEKLGAKKRMQARLLFVLLNSFFVLGNLIEMFMRTIVAHQIKQNYFAILELFLKYCIRKLAQHNLNSKL